MIDQQTWLGLRVEYIEELTYQFELREKFLLLTDEKEILQTQKLIENSCNRCRCFDHIISESSNQFKK